MTHASTLSWGGEGGFCEEVNETGGEVLVLIEGRAQRSALRAAGREEGVQRAGRGAYRGVGTVGWVQRRRCRGQAEEWIQRSGYGGEGIIE